MKARTADEFMAGVFDTRRANLRAIAEANGGTVKLADMIGESQTRASQLLNRTFGEGKARKIEEALGIQLGSLDIQGMKAKKIRRRKA